MSVESIKENLKRGWPYALASIVIYFGINFLPIPPTFYLNLYVAFLLFAVNGSLLALLIIGSLLFFLPLFLGWLDRALEKKGISKIVERIETIVLGVIAMMISSIVIYILLIRLTL